MRRWIIPTRGVIRVGCGVTIALIGMFLLMARLAMVGGFGEFVLIVRNIRIVLNSWSAECRCARG